MLSKRVAHSAVVAGEPNEREVTRSNWESPRRSRAKSSARPRHTSPTEGTSGQASTSPMNLVRLSIESSSTVRCCQWSRRMSPGTPPPLPRSNTLWGASGRKLTHASIKPRACSIWNSTDFGPKKPRALDSSRARSNHGDVTILFSMRVQSPRNGEARRLPNE